MHARHEWCWIPSLTHACLGRCRLTFADIIFIIRRCYQGCVQSMIVVFFFRTMCAGHDRCRPTDVYTPHLMYAGLDLCNMTLADACRLRIMSPSRCTNATHETCRPSLMLVPLDNVVFHLRTCYVWWLQTTTDDSYLMCTNHVWCMDLFTDVAWHLQLSFSIYSHDMRDVCRPWPFSSSIGQCTQATTYVNQPM